MAFNDKNKSVAIIHRYFWPQNYPYAYMLKDISDSLICAGAALSVYTSYSGLKSEKEQRMAWHVETGAVIHSLNLPSGRSASLVTKAWHASKFFTWLLYKLIISRHDIFMVATTPPVFIAFLVTVVSKLKGAEVIYHCQDIHPESLYVNKSLNSVYLYRLLRFLDTYTVRNASKVIVLSEDMKRTVVKRGVSGENIHVINNFIFHSLGDAKSVNVSDFRHQERRIRFLFAGGLGRFQNLKLLIHALGFFKDRSDLEFMFLGDGPLKPFMQEYCELNALENILFREQVSVQEALEYMHESDIGLVSLAEGVIDVAYPSKSIMYLSTGLPLLAIIDEHSELFKMINEHGLGVAVRPTLKDIQQGVEKVMQDVKEKKYSRDRIGRFAHETFSKKKVLKKITNLILDEPDD